jgi:hypothetical protein
VEPLLLVVLIGVFSLAVGASLTSHRELAGWLTTVAPGLPGWVPGSVVASELLLLWLLVADPVTGARVAALWLLVGTAVITFAAYVRGVGGCACFGASSLASHPLRAIVRNLLLILMAVAIGSSDLKMTSGLGTLALVMAAALGTVGVSRTLAAT